MATLKKAINDAPTSAKSAEEEVRAFEETTERLEQEELRTELNESYTDEDGVVRNVPLLAGVEWDGEFYDHFSFREMDGRDEEAISKGENRTNGAKLVNVLCERCVVEFSNGSNTITKKDLGIQKWGKLIRSCVTGDLDYMMIKIRRLSKGDKITFTQKCPSCGTKVTTEVSMDEYNIEPFKGQFEIPFELPGKGYEDAKHERHKCGVLRLLTGYDREMVFPYFRKNQAAASTLNLTRAIQFDDGTPVFKDNVAAMSTRDRDYLNDLLSDNRFGVDSSIDIECPNCGAELSSAGGVTNFF